MQKFAYVSLCAHEDSCTVWHAELSLQFPASQTNMGASASGQSNQEEWLLGLLEPRRQNQ